MTVVRESPFFLPFLLGIAVVGDNGSEERGASALSKDGVKERRDGDGGGL